MREARGKKGAEGLAEALQIEPPAQPQWPFWRKKRESSSGEARMLTRRIVELGKRRQLDQVFQLLDDAKRSKKAVNMITMNAAMAACVNCGDIDRALDLFDDMTADGGTGVDSITYGTLLKGLGRAKRLDDAFEVLEAMEDGTAPGRPELTAVHLNTLVNACADAGDARRAMSVVQRYKRAFSGAIGPSAFTYNLLLKGYARSDNPLEALSVAEEMHLQGLQWERVTFNCLILACVRAGDMDRALDLLQDMKAEALRRGDDDVLPDAVTYTTIIKGLSEDGDIDALRDVVADMKRASCVRSPAGPSQPHCLALLAAEGPSGVAAVEEGVSSAGSSATSSSSSGGSAVADGSSTGSGGGASSNPLVMDRVAYTAIIDAFIAVGSPEDALQCMAELEELGRTDRSMRPRAHVFLSLMRSLAAAGDLPSTQQLAARLVRDAGGRVWPEERAEAAELVLEAATRASEMGVAARLLDQMEAMHGHQLRMSLRGMQAVVQLMAATGAGFERFTPIGIRQELSLRDTVQSVMVPLADVEVAHPDQSLAELRSARPDLMPADVIPVINGADECVGVLRVPSHAMDPATLVSHLMLPPPPSLSCLSTVSEAALLLSSRRTPLAAVVAGSARMRYGLAKEAVQRGAGEERRVVGFVRAEAVFEGHGGCWWHSGEQREEGDGGDEAASVEGGDVRFGEAECGGFGARTEGSSSDFDSLVNESVELYAIPVPRCSAIVARAGNTEDANADATLFPRDFRHHSPKLSTAFDHPLHNAHHAPLICLCPCPTRERQKLEGAADVAYAELDIGPPSISQRVIGSTSEWVPRPVDGQIGLQVGPPAPLFSPSEAQTHAGHSQSPGGGDHSPSGSSFSAQDWQQQGQRRGETGMGVLLSPGGAWGRLVREWRWARVQYLWDVLLERHPVVYIMLLMTMCTTLVFLGGFLFHTFRIDRTDSIDCCIALAALTAATALFAFSTALTAWTHGAMAWHGRRHKSLGEDMWDAWSALVSSSSHLKRSRRPQEPFGEALWDAWGNVCSSRQHLRESTQEGRVIGIMLTLGGLFFYSLLTSTMTAQFKVMERDHIVIGGINNRLATLLRQLSKSQHFAVQDGSALTRKRTVLLLTELPRKETEKIVSPYLKDCQHINLFIRSGPLSSTASFKKVAADRARSVILLAPKDDYYEADADVVMSVIALKPLLRGSNTGVVAEVSKGSTGSLLRGMAEVRVSAVENLSAKLFVQCSRQPGLVDVYCKLLDHTALRAVL
ncbi:unnamed protein product [Closterium sp. Yama58-4]|nr:unnamed protein product [Closterium sp. Yama58-4]